MKQESKNIDAIEKFIKNIHEVIRELAKDNMSERIKKGLARRKTLLHSTKA